jgi:hypothetical protein
MSIIRNIIKQNVSNLLSEDVFGKHNDAKTISKSGSVTHDKVATHSAKIKSKIIYVLWVLVPLTLTISTQ